MAPEKELQPTKSEDKEEPKEPLLPSGAEIEVVAREKRESEAKKPGEVSPSQLLLPDNALFCLLFMDCVLVAVKPFCRHHIFLLFFSFLADNRIRHCIQEGITGSRIYLPKVLFVIKFSKRTFHISVIVQTSCYRV